LALRASGLARDNSCPRSQARRSPDCLERSTPAKSSVSWQLAIGEHGSAGETLPCLCCLFGSACVPVRCARCASKTVDWRVGELVVRGKGNRVERLPLPPDVGEAVAAYLQRGRPATAQGRTIFVRVRAPHRPLSSAGVTNAVLMAASRAGVTAHRLRRTVATQMVEREGLEPSTPAL